MLSSFPNQISNKAIIVYLISLTTVSFVFNRFVMGVPFILLGIVEVSLFFALSVYASKTWLSRNSSNFMKGLFLSALTLRLIWVVFSYFFYINLTGVPYEPGAADSMAYHATAEWLKGNNWGFVFDYLFNRGGVSDSGYAFYLTTIYKVFGSGVIIPRILKAIYSSVTCLLIYKLASRSIDEHAGRLAGIFSAFMPNLIIYCGLHLKETEMILLLVAFLERSDYLLRSRKYDIITILVPLVLALSLFFFRTVLGAVAVFSLLTATLFTSTQIVGMIKKALVAGWMIVAIIFFAGGTIATEVEGYFEERTENQDAKRAGQTMHGNQWAKYATGAVMAPMMFALPFSTMVNVDEQYNQQIMHGGNFVRNFMGYFVIVALFLAIFVNKDWRNLSLVGSYTIGYLGVLSMSGFANSERFLLPALPGLIVMWAYGVRHLDRRTFKWLRYWLVIVFLMQVAWAYFKLGSRGLF